MAIHFIGQGFLDALNHLESNLYTIKEEFKVMISSDIAEYRKLTRRMMEGEAVSYFLTIIPQNILGIENQMKGESIKVNK